jgi:predicted ribosome quality control (RQC) complex YloA/Tae2 family protein
MDSLDKLLAQLKAEYDESAPPEQKTKPSAKPLIQPPSNSASSIDNLLAEVKTQYEEQDQVEELRKQQEQQQQQIRQQQLKAQKLEALKIRAKAWVESIDPLSSEGLWFEKFAEKYPSKLEAALEYLQEIEEKKT